LGPIQFNAEVTDNIEQSKQLAKRSFKKEIQSYVQLTLILVDQKPHAQLISMYDQRKAELLEKA
jgi:hypothetical protein